MLGIPSKEIKQAVEHADRSLSNLDAAIQEARVVLRHVAGIAEDLRTLSAALRAIVERQP